MIFSSPMLTFSLLTVLVLTIMYGLFAQIGKRKMILLSSVIF